MAERDQARQNLQLARELMSDVIGPTAQALFNFPFAQDYRKQVLQQARDFYERLLPQSGDDPQLRRELAGIHRQLGLLAQEIGQDAEPEYQRSLSILADLVKRVSERSPLPRRSERLLGLLSVWYAVDLRPEEALQQGRIVAGDHARSRGGVSLQRRVSPIAAHQTTIAWGGSWLTLAGSTRPRSTIGWPSPTMDDLHRCGG